MARILFVHIRYPEFDRCSGDVRVSNMLRILATRHQVALHVLHQSPAYLNAEATAPYRDMLLSSGIRVESGSLVRHLRHERYDAVVIEFWYVAHPIMRQVRALQPRARVIVDTEHVYFYSDRVREEAVGGGGGPEERERRKRVELQAYRHADAIITTTNEDRDVVHAEDATVVACTVPNIHALPAGPVKRREGRLPGSVIFIGNFRNNPSNADAALWFCTEVLPRLRQRVPQAKLRIVGNAPPPEVLALASDHVEVTGYVPQTAPYIDSSLVSVCPLRFGAGLKGKIGEALVHGLPVVSTAVGTQGMHLGDADGILVADDPQDFVDAIVRLFDDAALWRRQSLGGRDYIEHHFGFSAVQRQLDAIFSNLPALPSKQLPLPARWAGAVRAAAQDWLEAHVFWRLHRGRTN